MVLLSCTHFGETYGYKDRSKYNQTKTGKVLSISVTFQEKKTFYTEILHGRKCYKSPQETRTCISAGKWKFQYSMHYFNLIEIYRAILTCLFGVDDIESSSSDSDLLDSELSRSRADRVLNRLSWRANMRQIFMMSPIFNPAVLRSSSLDSWSVFKSSIYTDKTSIESKSSNRLP